MEYWDNTGQAYNDKQEVLNPMQKAYNKALAVGINARDWLNETNPESQAHAQKRAVTIGLESLSLPALKTLEYTPYIKDLWNGRNLILDRFTKNQEKIADDGNNFYQTYLQKTPANIKGYGEVTFSKHNKGKDKTADFLEYPFLRKNLEGSYKFNTTNYKNEPDRVYDYLTNNKSLYDYVIENIANKGKKYKMMHKK